MSTSKELNMSVKLLYFLNTRAGKRPTSGLGYVQVSSKIRISHF